MQSRHYLLLAASGAFAVIFFGLSSRPAQAGPNHPKPPAGADAISNAEPVSSDPQILRKYYQALAVREAGKNHLPPEIASAVMAIESGFDPKVIGSAGEIGLMQVRPGTAAMLGFKGSAEELAEPEINIRYGVAYLAEAWRLANGDLCRALMKYRAGHGEEFMTSLSADYCSRARAHLASVGSAYADAPNAVVTRPSRNDLNLTLRTGSKHGPAMRTAATSRAFWAAHDARVRALSARIEAKWRRMASR